MTYRLGIIGLGRVAWLLEQDPLRGKPCTHLGAWQERPDVRLVAACDHDPDALQRFHNHYPDVACYADYRAMLDQQHLDLVSICAYTDSRCDMVVAAAAAGVRGLWCEKALAQSLSEAHRMAAAIQAAQAQLIVTFTRRWQPLYTQVGDWLAAGRIGQLETINVHYSGQFLHTGTHAFDVLRLWCGEVAQVQAWLQPAITMGDDDNTVSTMNEQTIDQDCGGFAIVDFVQGARACIHGHEKGYFRFEFELLGDRGLLRVGNTQRELWQVAESPHFSDFYELQPVAFPAVCHQNTWRAAADNLINAVEGRAVPQCTLQDGQAALAIALAAHYSHQQQHQPVAPSQIPLTLQVLSR
jgi:predicted dehydrogenase